MSNSGTIEFKKPVEETKVIPGYESIVTLMFSAYTHGVNVMGDDSFANWFNRNAMRTNIESAVGDMLKENQELKALCREILTAREQYQFFVNGYANGSASISEANHAATVEHEAYSKLWEFLKQSSL